MTKNTLIFLLTLIFSVGTACAGWVNNQINQSVNAAKQNVSQGAKTAPEQQSTTANESK